MQGISWEKHQHPQLQRVLKKREEAKSSIEHYISIVPTCFDGNEKTQSNEQIQMKDVNIPKGGKIMSLKHLSYELQFQEVSFPNPIAILYTQSAVRLRIHINRYCRKFRLMEVMLIYESICTCQNNRM